MSKYIYTTIYEEFTGLKPPEPKNHKPRRRRGYGHPYRMRLNMQEEGQPGELNDIDVPEEELQPHSFLSHSPNRADNHKTTTVYRSPRGRHVTASPSHSPHSMQSAPMISESPRKADSAPKVTYKKRRQYSEAASNTLLSD